MAYRFDSNKIPSRPLSLVKEQKLGIFLILVGLFVLLGWAAGQTSWVQLNNLWPLTPILSAINFLILGLILEGSAFIGKNANPQKRLKVILSILFSWIFASSILVLIRNLFGLSFVPESLFWPKTQTDLTGHIHLMSIASASSFLMTGLLVLLDIMNEKRKWLKLIFNILPLLMSFSVLIAYAYQASEVYEYSLFKNTSFLTAIVFLIFHIYWWVSQYSSFYLKIRSQDTPLYISFTVIFITFALLGVTSSRSLVLLIEAHKSQVKIQEQIKDLQQIFVSLLNIETGGRGYALTGDKTYLEPYELGLANYRFFVDHFKLANSRLGEASQTKLQEIEFLANQKIENVQSVIKYRKKNGILRTAEFISTDQGKKIMDQIRELVEDLTQLQVHTLKIQSEKNRSRASFTIVALVSGTLFAAIVLVFCFIAYRRMDRDRKAAEDEIKNLNEILSLKLKETENLNKELESFSYSVSHDLRAPLRAMAGFGEILIEDLGPRLEKSDIDNLTRIIKASEKMSKLIDGLLILSRLTRTQVNKADINISKITTDLAQDFEATEGHRKLNLKFNAGANAYGDEMLVILLMQNLLGNAWKFSSKKANPEIEVGSFDRGVQKVFYVQDNGAGFDMKYSNKLFGTFQRLHFEDEFQGTGIGLATSKRIVSMHFGEIWAEGKENEGATFYFTLPSKGILT